MLRFFRSSLFVVLYSVLFSIGLYLIITNKDWRGYVALISTPLLHTLIKAIEKQINTKAVARQIKK